MRSGHASAIRLAVRLAQMGVIGLSEAATRPYSSAWMESAGAT